MITFDGMKMNESLCLQAVVVSCTLRSERPSLLGTSASENRRPGDGVLLRHGAIVDSDLIPS